MRVRPLLCLEGMHSAESLRSCLPLWGARIRVGLGSRLGSWSVRDRNRNRHRNRVSSGVPCFRATLHDTRVGGALGPRSNVGLRVRVGLLMLYSGLAIGFGRAFDAVLRPSYRFRQGF